MSDTLFDFRLKVDLPSFHLDYTLQTDERTVGVFGHSGAGKTTVIEHIAGWRRGAEGHVRVAGRTLFDSKKGVYVHARMRGIGYLPQDILLFPHWTVIKNVMAGRNRPGGAGATIDVDHVLEVLELGAMLDRPVQRLSGGERHRVALARALCSQPSLLLLDEPLASLDNRLRHRILSDLVRVRDEFRVPILLISHNPLEVQVLCDRVQRLERGKVLAEGTPAAVLGSTGDDFENVLRGTVAGILDHTARVELASGHEVTVPRGTVSKDEKVVLGVRADDILVAMEPPRGLSARNLLPGRIASVGQAKGSVALGVDLLGGGRPLQLQVHVTEDAATDLHLTVGAEVTVILKSRSLEILTSYGD